MDIEWVRVSRDLYGQSSITGAGWDPLPYFAALGLAVIVLHALYKLVRPSKH